LRGSTSCGSPGWKSGADYRAGEDVSAEQAASVVAEARVFVAAARALLDTLPP
jgi:hypothetical protein